MWDVIIVGGGTAGSILATRLSEDPGRSVLLIEAGPDFPDAEHTPEVILDAASTSPQILAAGYSWNFLSQSAHGGRPIQLRPGKITGGSSAVNGQAFPRAMPEDFEIWEARGATGWAYQDVLPYYRRVETDLDFQNEYHGADGPVRVRRIPLGELTRLQRAFMKSCSNHGHPFCSDDALPGATGVGSFPYNTLDGVRQSTALTYLSQARARPNLRIMDMTTVERLMIEDGRVVAVEIERGGRRERLSADSYVLTAGAVMSPTILLRSGVGPADELVSVGITPLVDLPGVGKNLQDHPLVELHWEPTPQGFTGDAPALQLICRFTASGSRLTNDLKIYMRNHMIASAAVGGPVGMLVGLELPDSRGSVTLRATDPGGPPEVNLNALGADGDADKLTLAVEHAFSIADDVAFRGLLARRLVPAPDDVTTRAKLKDWLLRNVSTTQHPSGTCAMGNPDDPMTVVDPRGAVRGLENLVVADASIIPSIPRANLNATVMMIAERVADFLGCVKSASD